MQVVGVGKRVERFIMLHVKGLIGPIIWRFVNSPLLILSQMLIRIVWADLVVIVAGIFVGRPENLIAK
jgi:hypothetical protein